MFHGSQGSEEYSEDTTHAPTPAQDLRCNLPRCPYRTDRAYNLERHKERHQTPTDNKQHCCPVCIYSSDKISNLKRHINIRHPSELEGEESMETAFVDRSTKAHCHVLGCRYETNRPYDMKRHMAVHNNLEKSHRSFKCLLCMYSSNRKANLKRHQELRHSGIQEAIQTAEEEELQLSQDQFYSSYMDGFEDDPPDEQRQELEAEAEAEAAVAEEAETHELEVDFIYGENAAIVTKTPSNAHIYQGSEKQVIAINMNGQLRWFQAIDPPPGAVIKMKLASQLEQEQLDDELALSLADVDKQDILELMTPTPEEGHTWSVSLQGDEIETVSSLANERQELRPSGCQEEEEEAVDFPFWWDDGEYTKMQRNHTYRALPEKPSPASVQDILRSIYDIYYKPFKEQRKHSQQRAVFQIKDSWLCATQMSRMQIIKDMYSKQGT